MDSSNLLNRYGRQQDLPTDNWPRLNPDPSAAKQFIFWLRRMQSGRFLIRLALFALILLEAARPISDLGRFGSRNPGVAVLVGRWLASYETQLTKGRNPRRDKKLYRKPRFEANP